jgi:acyl carrier protein
MNSELRQKLLLASSVVQQKQILINHVQEQLAETLNLSSLSDIDPQQSLIELVNDSLRAVDFKILLENSLGCKLRSTLLFDYPRINVLVEYLFKEVLQLTSSSDIEKTKQCLDKKDKDEEASLTKEKLAELPVNEIAYMLAKELNTLSVKESL